ncbi:MAG: sugar ABC transporter ATP-binding protein [Atribacterota bacterium]
MITVETLEKSDGLATSQNVIMCLRGVKKSFPGVQALKGVDFELRRGEVHALIGENGAGKSTLVKIVMGVYRKDEGVMLLDGREVDFSNPEQAREHGITMVFQELSLIPYLDVAQNIFLGREPKNKFGLVKYRELYRWARELIERYHLQVPFKVSDTIVSLGRGNCQIVEILKALAREAKVLILDEPTASLTKDEEDSLYEIIMTLKARGVSVIYISHRLEEVLRNCDRITVLRDGVKVTTGDAQNLNVDVLVEMMTGKSFHGKQISRGETNIRRLKQPILAVRNLSVGERVRGVSFEVYAGEVLGITGLMGSGKSEIARALFGIDHPRTGEITLQGKLLNVRNPIGAIRNGIALIPEDRKREGLILIHSVEDNVTLSVIRDFSRAGWFQRKRARREVEKQVYRLMIKTPTLQQQVQYLSGGNQQKVVVGKWLMRKPKILILDEPTVGIDVNAKRELRDYVREMVADGSCGAILFSSDLNDIIQACDRVLVLYRGQIIKEYPHAALLSEESLHRAIQGVVEA